MKKNKLVILSLIGALLFCACAGTYPIGITLAVKTFSLESFRESGNTGSWSAPFRGFFLLPAQRP